MIKKPYLVVVPLVAVLFLVIFLIDKKRYEKEQAAAFSKDRVSMSGAGTRTADGETDTRPATREKRVLQDGLEKIRTDSGLVYQIIKKGSGVRPGPGDKVKVVYRGYLPDGTEFDRSPEGKPVTFPLNLVIRGWSEGLQLMQVGASYRFTIPPELAYGARGAGQIVGPNQTLVFDVELLEVVE